MDKDSDRVTQKVRAEMGMGFVGASFRHCRVALVNASTGEISLDNPPHFNPVSNELYGRYH